MAEQSRGRLRNPIILTAVITLVAPVVLSEAATAATYCVWAAMVVCLAWWGRYFFVKQQTRTKANAVSYYNQGLYALEASNFPIAMQWFTLSANLGNAGAMNQIGLLHMSGSGVPQDDRLAAEWFQQAVAQGDQDNAPLNLEQALARLREWQRQQTGGGSHTDEAGRATMTRASALEVFDLQEGATPADIRAAYLRLMQQVHPDRGGSNFFAKQLNEARNLLLAD